MLTRSPGLGVLRASPAWGVQRGGTSPLPSPLLTDLVSYWKLDEASGQRADSVGSNHLSDNNTVTSSTGVQGNAAQFTAANSEYLSVANNATLQTGNIDFTLAGWAYLTSYQNRTLAARFKFTGSADREWLIDYNQDASLNRWRFIVSPDGSASTVLVGNNAGQPSLNTRYLVIVWHDSVGNTINIQVNNGTPNSASHSSGVYASASNLIIGARDNGLSNFWNGLVDEFGFWKRVLTSDERTALYNAGAGVTYPFR